MIRTFTELCTFRTFEDRFRYLMLQGTVGQSTFGFDRFMNQEFYRSTQWKHIRNAVIARDQGCDLALNGRDIFDRIIIHHMNPMTQEDLVGGRKDILDPEFLITTTHNTHNAIHYGDESLLIKPLVSRRPGDTKLWGNN